MYSTCLVDISLYICVVLGRWNDSNCDKVHGSDGASFNPYIQQVGFINVVLFKDIGATLLVAPAPDLSIFAGFCPAVQNC